MLILGEEAVRRALGWPACIALMREAMTALSAGRPRHVPRRIVALDRGLFGIMAGALGADACFGAKLISVFPGNAAQGRATHQGGILLFDAGTGAPAALVHAGAVTAIRTAAVSAMATDALARPDAGRLALLGYGEQARAHVRALALVRHLDAVTVWGRDPARRSAFAAWVEGECGLACTPCGTAAEAVAEADIVCTLTAAADPILSGRDLPEGVHVNLVGASHAGAAEADTALVARAACFGDDRAHVMAQAGEWRRAREAGAVTEAHFRGEIGAVLSGALPGRTSDREVTVYKSLGHIVQDLAAAREACRVGRAEGLGRDVPFH